MSDDLLFAAVRRACSPRVWSRGVELARSGAVIGEREEEDEIVLRVAVPGVAVAPEVTLWPEEVEWDCECQSRQEACFHVAAAVIALRRAHEAGDAVPQGSSLTARVGYRFRRAPDGLSFDRVLVRGDGDDVEETPLTERLTVSSRKRIAGATLFTTAADMTIEVALGARQRGVLPVKTARAVLKQLAPNGERSPDVCLDGAPVMVRAEPVRPHIKVADDRKSDGFIVKLVLDPEVTERFANGVVLCGETLRPTGSLALEKDQVRRLRAGIRYPREQAAGLLSDVLPFLEKHTTVHRVSKRLPRPEGDHRPRITFETQRKGDQLAVLPTIVYGDPAIARLDGQRLVPLAKIIPERDRDAEELLRGRLRRRLDMMPGRPVLYAAEEALAIGERLAAFGELRGEAHREFYRAGGLTPRIVGDGRKLAITFEAEPGAGAGDGGGRREVDAEQVIAAWERGDGLVALDGGGFAPLPADWLERYGPHIAFLLAARAGDGTVQPWARPALAELAVDLNAKGLDPDLDGLRALADDFAGLPAATLPDDLTATLRDYQESGARWLAFLGRAGLGALLADDMGLGKTLQALTTLEVGARALVVVPTSVLHAWEDEIRRFRPALTVHRYYGPSRSIDATVDVTLTTYAILRRDRDKLRRAPARGRAEPAPWNMVILDEAQTIKNPESKVAQAAFEVEAEHRIALTGTPVENRLDELWSILFFLNRGLLGTRSDFRSRFAEPIAAGSAAAAANLRQRIRPFVLRRRKSEVARELPPRTEVVLRCELDREERELYEALQAATRAEVAERLAAGKGGAQIIKALEALLRLRQAACHRGLIPGQEAATSSKIELLRETLEEIVAEGHKALVFSQWTSLLDRIEPVLTKAGLGFTRLDGSTRDREAVVRTFQDPAPDAPPVMLISLKAGGTGLTLTAADHVFLVDPWWNPAVEDQAADRAHRIGQDRPVLIHRLVAENTVEERILALQERKRAIADAALGEANQAAGLTKEDLLALLE
ncbi:MAG: DEAD/DEAH box helicase [Nannocystaceae bacterium]